MKYHYLTIKLDTQKVRERLHDSNKVSEETFTVYPIEILGLPHSGGEKISTVFDLQSELNYIEFDFPDTGYYTNSSQQIDEDVFYLSRYDINTFYHPHTTKQSPNPASGYGITFEHKHQQQAYQMQVLKTEKGRVYVRLSVPSQLELKGDLEKQIAKENIRKKYFQQVKTGLGLTLSKEEPSITKILFDFTQGDWWQPYICQLAMDILKPKFIELIKSLTLEKKLILGNSLSFSDIPLKFQAAIFNPENLFNWRLLNNWFYDIFLELLKWGLQITDMNAWENTFIYLSYDNAWENNKNNEDNYFKNLCTKSDFRNSDEFFAFDPQRLLRTGNFEMELDYLWYGLNINPPSGNDYISSRFQPISYIKTRLRDKVLNWYDNHLSYYNKIALFVVFSSIGQEFLKQPENYSDSTFTLWDTFITDLKIILLKIRERKLIDALDINLFHLELENISKEEITQIVLEKC